MYILQVCAQLLVLRGEIAGATQDPLSFETGLTFLDIFFRM